jgi:hypothetical protein
MTDQGSSEGAADAGAAADKGVTGAAAEGAAVVDAGAQADGAANGSEASDTPSGADLPRLEFLPPEIYEGKSAQEQFEALAKNWKLLRDKLATNAGAPKSADEYSYELADDVKELAGDIPADDPAIQVLREEAHAAGLSGDQFKTLVPKLIERFAKEGIFSDPIDYKKEIEKLGGKESALKRTYKISQMGDKLLAEKQIDKTMREELESLNSTAAGVKLVEFLLGGKEHGLQAGAGTPAGGFTKEQLDEMVADERYDTSSPKYDKAFRADVEEKFKRFYAK